MLSIRRLSILYVAICFAKLSSAFYDIPNGFAFTSNNNDVHQPNNFVDAINITNKNLDNFMQSQRLPSLAFGISVRGRTVYFGARGFLDLENNVTANINAMYRMASVTKTFTSTLIGTLVDAGKLRYEDSIYKHLPANALPQKTFKGKHVDITVGEVLSHMAGFRATDLKDFNNLYTARNSTESLRRFSQEPLDFEPGTDWEYSNYGFEVLGAIVENITGHAYPDVMDDFVHKKLMLTSGTMMERNGVLLNYHPRPKYYRNHPVTNATIPAGPIDDAIMSTGIWAAGGLLSNIGDLLAYGNHLIDAYHQRPNAILKNETLAKIWTKRSTKAAHFPAPLRPMNEYGYGWMITDTTNGETSKIRDPHAYWHSGGLLGVSTFLVVYPQEEIVALALTNKGSVSGMETVIVDAVQTLFRFVQKH